VSCYDGVTYSISLLLNTIQTHILHDRPEPQCEIDKTTPQLLFSDRNFENDGTVPEISSELYSAVDETALLRSAPSLK